MSTEASGYSMNLDNWLFDTEFSNSFTGSNQDFDGEFIIDKLADDGILQSLVDDYSSTSSPSSISSR